MVKVIAGSLVKMTVRARQAHDRQGYALMAWLMNFSVEHTSTLLQRQVAH
jgi:hypothetical protein